MVKYFIENGADVDSVNEDGISIILNTVGKSSFEIFELLVNSGIDLKSDIKRILADATALNKEKIINLLIEKNIDMNIVLERNTTPLLNVIISGNKNLINTLLKVSDINYCNENDIALIANLTYYKDYKLMKELIDRGADVNIPTNRVTALHNAIAKKASVSILKLLIEKGAIIETVGPRGITSLHNAVIVNYLDAVKLLVESGADVNATMVGGNTPLGLARVKKHKSIYKYLKQNGANNYKQDLIIAIIIFISVLLFVPTVLKIVFG